MSMTIPPVASPGTLPEVGQRAPEFELPDSMRALHRLSDLASAGPVVLLFYRGHW